MNDRPTTVPTPHVFGRSGASDAPSVELGHFRATDGSAGGPVALDVDRPHVGLVVGKRGSGKSNTLAVIAEGLAGTSGVAPVLLDPMGEFASLAAGVPGSVIEQPTIPASALSPADWCSLLDVEPTGAVGGLIWQAASRSTTLAGLHRRIRATGVPSAVKRAAANHLRLAADWGVFDPDGLEPATLRSSRVTVLDVSGYDDRVGAAILYAVATGLYHDARTRDGRLPWLLVDEAARLTTDLARPSLRRLVTRGRTPGVSAWLATQRPGALPRVAVSQADLLVAHRLTAERDIQALERSSPTYLTGQVTDRLPTRRGDAIVVDDATERATTIRVAERSTPHGGGTPRASDRVP